MPKKTSPDTLKIKKENHLSTKGKGTDLASKMAGQRLRAIRKSNKLSIRSLAEISGLSANTLSLIENGKTSPSVNTLSHLAQSMNIPITAFFEGEQHVKRIAYQKAGERKQILFAQGQLESLSTGMTGVGSEPFIITLGPNAHSGEAPVIYAGRELIYCLEGQITYTIEDQSYLLAPGDSLIFDAYIPHSWCNTNTKSSALLVLCPEDTIDTLPKPYLIP